MSNNRELHHSAMSVYEEAMGLDSTVESTMMSKSPEEILKSIPMDKLLECYNGQMDYDGKAYLLERISEIDADIAKQVLLDDFESECEQFATYEDHDYEIEFLTFLHGFDSTLFETCVRAKLRHTMTPWYAMYIIDEVLSRWTEEHIKLLVLRMIELEDDQNISQVVSQLSDYEDDIKRTIRDLRSEFENNLHPEIQTFSMEKVFKAFDQEFEK